MRTAVIVLGGVNSFPPMQNVSYNLLLLPKKLVPVMLKRLMSVKIIPLKELALIIKVVKKENANKHLLQTVAYAQEPIQRAVASVQDNLVVRDFYGGVTLYLVLVYRHQPVLPAMAVLPVICSENIILPVREIQLSVPLKM